MSLTTRLAALFIVVASFCWQTSAQTTTNAICTTALFTANHEGQSPCLVASALQGACTGGIFNLPALLPGHFYTGPIIGGSDECTCSSVTYSMVSACGDCQGAEVEFWSDWITNCTATDVSLGSFPLPLPQGITVPAWAYLDVSTGNQWSATDAQSIEIAGTQPDSSASGPTATGNPGSPGRTSGSSHSSLNIPAIAGGAAGGGVVLIIIAVLVFFLIRRNKRRARTPPSAQPIPVYGEKSDFPSSGYSGTPGAVPPSQVPMPYYGNPTATPDSAPTFQSHPEPMKLYDPADPSTFPTLPGSAAPASTNDTASPVPTSQAPTGANVQYGNSASPPMTPYSDSTPYGTAPAPYGSPMTLPYQTDSTNYAGAAIPSSPPADLSVYGGASRPFSQQTTSPEAGGYTRVSTGTPLSQGKAGGPYSGMPEL
ncbi:hypothetical protein K439DRAFT_1634096 [Ramaria rubella]|nr:hypothetical protein K439DRAFT_1634096 [Ramaria rubella]